jgi:hypothetical protein
MVTQYQGIFVAQAGDQPWLFAGMNGAALEGMIGKPC